MTNKKAHIVLSKSKCISFEQMQAYLLNKLSASEKHSVEIHLLDCDFCAEAFEGYEQYGTLEEHFETIEKLNHEIIAKALNTRIIIPKKKKTPFIFAIAAAVALIFGITYIFISGNNTATKETFAEQKKEIKYIDSLKQIKDTAKILPIEKDKNLAEQKKDTFHMINPPKVGQKAQDNLVAEKENTKKKTRLVEEANSPDNNQNDIAYQENTQVDENAADESQTYENHVIATTRSAFSNTTKDKEKRSQKTQLKSTKAVSTTSEMLKQLAIKMKQKDYPKALNLIYQLEHSKDKTKLKKYLILSRARIFSAQMNKQVAVNYLKSIKDSKINRSKDFVNLLDSLQH